jgi:hypothetical protein
MGIHRSRRYIHRYRVIEEATPVVEYVVTGSVPDPNTFPIDVNIHTATGTEGQSFLGNLVLMGDATLSLTGITAASQMGVIIPNFLLSPTMAGVEGLSGVGAVNVAAAATRNQTGVVASSRLGTAVASVPSVWTLTNLSTRPVHWFDAQDTNTITKDGSNFVSQWNDKGTRAANATESVSKPVWLATGINSLPSMHVTGSTQKMTFAASSSLVRINTINSGSFGVVVSATLPSNSVNITSSTVPTILAVTWNTSSYSLWQNGTLVGSASIALTPPGAAFIVGNSAFNSGRFYDTGVLMNRSTADRGIIGDLGEFVILSYEPSISDRQLIEGYAAWRWNMQTSLPVSHSYKNAAPALIPNTPPTASITSPSNGSSFVVSGSISFVGSATDSTDGVLTGSALVWTSNVDGALGTGSTFSKSTLSLGSHIITLKATDSLGLTGSVVSNVSITTASLGTVITDTFTRSSQYPLGACDTGQVWVNFGGGGLAVNSFNQAYPQFATLGAGSYLECGISDGTVQATVINASVNNFSIVFRYASQGNYWEWVKINSIIYVRKWVAGSSTDIVNNTITHTNGGVYSVVMSGDTLTFIKDGVTVRTLTSQSYNNTATKHGLGAWPNAIYDDFGVNSPGASVGAAAKLAVIQQPGNCTTGFTLNPQPSFKVLDGNSRLVTSDTSTITVSLNTISGAGFLTGSTSSVAAAGVAQFNTLSVVGTGSFTLTATDGSLTAVTTTQFNSVAGASSPGAFYSRSVMVSGSLMNFQVFIPQDYDATRAYPTIMALHGSGEKGTDNQAQINSGCGSRN